MKTLLLIILLAGAALAQTGGPWFDTSTVIGAASNLSGALNNKENFQVAGSPPALCGPGRDHWFNPITLLTAPCISTNTWGNPFLSAPTPTAGHLFFNGSVLAWDPAVYLSANQSISFTPTGDIGSVGGSGSTSLTPALTVNGLKGLAIPSLTAGHLQYNGSAYVWDPVVYASLNNTSLTGATSIQSLTITAGAGTVECLHRNTAGLVSGTGADCGAGGGGGANAAGLYWVAGATNAPANAVNLGLLSNGLVVIAVAGGVATPSVVAAPVGAVVGATDTQTLTNKTVDGVSPATMAFVDPTSSIQAQLNAKSGWPAAPGIVTCTGTPCTAFGTSATAPAGTIVGTTDTQTLTGKTVDGVSPATMAFVDPTSSIQTQLNSKSGMGAGGDLSGTLPSPTVKAINGVPLCTGFTPATGQALTYSTALSPNPCYTAVSPSGGGEANIYSGIYGGASEYTKLGGGHCVSTSVTLTGSSGANVATSSQQFSIVTVPAEWNPTLIKIEETTAIACTSCATNMSSWSLSVGDAASPSYYVQPYTTVNSAGYLGSNFKADNVNGQPTSLGSDTLVLQIQVTNTSPGNLGTGTTSDLTAGVVAVKVCGFVTN